MPKAQMKEWRKNFNKVCLERDKNVCRTCGEPATEVHHITDRHEIPNDGYVAENGISLCMKCHWDAEEFHRHGVPLPGFSPDDLYGIIGSSLEKATQASLKLAKITK